MNLHLHVYTHTHTHTYTHRYSHAYKKRREITVQEVRKIPSHGSCCGQTETSETHYANFPFILNMDDNHPAFMAAGHIK